MNLVEALAWGLVAGAVGTAAQTLSERAEQSVTHRQDSLVPAEVGAKLLRPRLDRPPDVSRLGLAVHWGHGLTMGLVRGLLGLTGLGAFAASALHYVVVWSGDAGLYRALGVAPAPWKWGLKRCRARPGPLLPVLPERRAAPFLANRPRRPMGQIRKPDAGWDAARPRIVRALRQNRSQRNPSPRPVL